MVALKIRTGGSKPSGIIITKRVSVFGGGWGTNSLTDFKKKVKKRFQRYASIQERLIGPDGTYPIIGRSITYRMGIFHSLALCAYDKILGDDITYAQVRCALTAVLKKIMDTDIFTEDGWLRIGVAGEQPMLGESYINTGSLYLCSSFFLPLVLFLHKIYRFHFL